MSVKPVDKPAYYLPGCRSRWRNASVHRTS